MPVHVVAGAGERITPVLVRHAVMASRCASRFHPAWSNAQSAQVAYTWKTWL
ncbi:hypothetical protein [Micromonospora chalcea]|uniref:hypothetical protein n=1 Tax=Micromonospora chalcea TaxID=1874 RepID=UPI003F49CC22